MSDTVKLTPCIKFKWTCPKCNSDQYSNPTDRSGKDHPANLDEEDEIEIDYGEHEPEMIGQDGHVHEYVYEEEYDEDDEDEDDSDLELEDADDDEDFTDSELEFIENLTDEAREELLGIPPPLSVPYEVICDNCCTVFFSELREQTV